MSTTETDAAAIAAAAEAKALADKSAADAADAANADKRFSQADLDRIAGSARVDGRSTAEKELLAELGVTDVAAAKAALAAQAAAEEANKTELQKAVERADKAEAIAATAREGAAALFIDTKLEGALRDAGVNPDRLPLALQIAPRSSLTVENGAVAGLAEAVEAVKAGSPEWFGKTGTSGAADTTSPPATTTDFRTDPAARKAELAKYGIRF